MVLLCVDLVCGGTDSDELNRRADVEENDGDRMITKVIETMMEMEMEMMMRITLMKMECS